MVVGDFAKDVDTVVIGGGPGGYVAAIRAAQLGKSVTLIEREFIGGVCLNVGCIPSKALITASHRYWDVQHSQTMGVTVQKAEIDFAALQKWKDDKVVKTLTHGVTMLLKKHKVDIVTAEAFFVDDHHLRAITEDSAQTYHFEHCIIATGSRPIEIQGFPFAGRVIDSTGGLNLQEIPTRLVVVGGGYVGTELAGAYAALGSKVTILEGTTSILPNFDKDAVKIAKSGLTKKGVEIITSARALHADDTGTKVTVTYESEGVEKSIDADYVMVTVGRRPNTDGIGLEYTKVDVGARGYIPVDAQCRTSVDNIYAIGDIVAGPALAHKASYEGKVAAGAIAGEATAVDYQAIPAVCFTDPEIASVGLSLDEARSQGYGAAKAFTFPLAANGRALSMNATEGFVKLITDHTTNLLLGAEIVGPSASENISELTLAIECGLTVEDIALTIHNHPSLGEAIMDASELALGQPIHI